MINVTIPTDIWRTTHTQRMIETVQYFSIREMKEILKTLHRTQALCGKLHMNSKHCWVCFFPFDPNRTTTLNVNCTIFFWSICRTSLLRRIDAIWKQITLGTRILWLFVIATSTGRLCRSVEQSIEYKTTTGYCIWWLIRWNVGRLVSHEVSTFGNWCHCIVRTNTSIYRRLQSFQHDFDIRIFGRA